MTARRLSPSLALVVSIALVGCTTPARPESSESAQARAAIAYVNLLRGENDLAHGSLLRPPQAMLPAFAAASRALRYVGKPTPAVSPQALADLARRGGDDPAWSLAYACAAMVDEAGGGDAEGIDPAVVEAIAPSQTIERATPADANSTADRVVAERALACLGDDVTVSSSEWGAMSEHAATNPLLAIQVAALARSSRADITLDVGPLAVNGLADEIEAEGCTGWTHASSAALSALRSGWSSRDDPPLPSAVAACAATDDLTIDDAAVFGYLVDAGVPASRLRTTLAANPELIADALDVEGRATTSSDSPIGLGTLASTRDAVTLLRLRGASTLPAWIRDGVERAAREGVRDEELVDALYLCSAVEADCAASVVSAARQATDRAVRVGIGDPADGAAAARAVETAREAGLAVPEACTTSVARGLLESAPRLLAALAVGEKACVERLSIDDDAYLELVREAVDDLRPEDALAFCLLRLLATDASAASPSTFDEEAHALFAALWSRLDRENGDDYLTSARPMRVELALAQEDQWISR